MVRFITKVEETLAHRKSHGPHWSYGGYRLAVF